MIAVITVLSLALKRNGNDLVVKPQKIKPSVPVKKEDPWKEIENIDKKTTGGRSSKSNNWWNSFIYYNKEKIKYAL